MDKLYIIKMIEKGDSLIERTNKAIFPHMMAIIR
jgi:hypothetical protein